MGFKVKKKAKCNGYFSLTGVVISEPFWSSGFLEFYWKVSKTGAFENIHVE